MDGKVVRTINSPDELKRVEIYRRDNGTFGFEEWQWDADDKCWIPLGRYSQPVVDSAERAETEARGRVSWLSSRQPNGEL